MRNTVFHRFDTELPMPERLNNPFEGAPDPLCSLACGEVLALTESHPEWEEELSRGKMFGVLVVKTEDGECGYLAAYSGQILGRSDWSGFVPAVFDYLQEGGHFRTGEAEIGEMNRRIEELESSKDYADAGRRLALARAEAERSIADYRARMAKAKKRRDALRGIEPEEALVAESQFQKAELRRLKKRHAEAIAQTEDALTEQQRLIESLRGEMRTRSDELQRWLFDQFMMLNGKGESRSLTDIFSAWNGQLPPAGAGECCAPKLLQYAFGHGLIPLALAEFWWRPGVLAPAGECEDARAGCEHEIRHHGQFYPPCRSKCLPILTYMLELGDGIAPREDGASAAGDGLRVIYQDNDIVVVDKPAGMLSVPGKGAESSAESFVRSLCPEYAGPVTVHRLDMDTGGVMVFAKNKRSHEHLQKQFRDRTVHKRYIAVLEHELNGFSRGTVSLPLCPDILDRPRQMVSRSRGKAAVSDVIFMGNEDGHARVALYPLTGRTHQLRVHCASPSGLGDPILGDRLYGHSDCGGRLHLQADKIVLTHPRTGKRMHFSLLP